ncbi:LytR/AlgR family response regulator transcription factor [Sphingobacterium prati]|uniref:LytR/AlgR family response regulator transcription factor n=1 Tax=Sphingobacterium prati TaxID=2737006 RepID=UPI0015546F02|nr:LytTR family DNA-binding domain-containing protein [Sphingobacterium prati]NPE47780.1 response regulator transcription factor [Sphingobacterium prati]
METSMVYRIGIVDDQLDELLLIQRYIADDPSLKIVFCTSDPVQALSLMEHQEVDILILDMNMQPLNGVQLLEALKVIPQVIVCSNHPEYVYETSPYQSAFIRKTIGRAAFKETIERVKALIDVTEEFVELNDRILDIKTSKSAGYHVQVNIDRMMLAVIDDKTMCFYKENTYRVGNKMYFTKNGNITMDLLERLLDKEQFVRVHRSYLVNMAYVAHYSIDYISVKGVDEFVPIGKTYRKRFKTNIDKYRKKHRC